MAERSIQSQLEQGRSLKEIINSGSYNPNSGDVYWWGYYDSILLQNSITQKYEFFSIGSGGNFEDTAVKKTLADINIKPPQIPAQQHFEAWGLCFKYLGDEIRTQTEYVSVMKTLDNLVLRFKLVDKSLFIERTLLDLFGPAISMIVTGVAAGDQVLNRSLFNSYYNLPIEWVLEAKCTIESEILAIVPSPVGLDLDKIKITLEGPKLGLN